MQTTQLQQTRRFFLRECGIGLGSIALSQLLTAEQSRAGSRQKRPQRPDHPPRAKAVIFLFMAGGPSQLDLLVDKPKLHELHGKLPPKEYMEGRRFAFLKGTETLLASARKFARD